ncbi:COG4315 family predicted lipoprotein [Rhodococcus opacus]|uniref:COG4315 family predicted lipoprotein n=1 Tax=Rhodococcus opacus TaxID=37919 RepID=UPI0022360AC8|nr:hypothetical protein [Rhodococcus opacus]UZG60210.1 hypothetical protein ONE62_41700 [Rhodococcus opacus]
MKKRMLLAQGIGIGAALMVLSACGNDNGDTQDAPPAGAAPQASTAQASTTPAGGSGAVQLGTQETALGTVVADPAGYTLYWFTEDTPEASACVGQCATVWPPTLGAPEAGSDVDLPGALGTLIRPDDGARQAVYDGHPLYRFAKDTAPGQTNGEGVKGQWHVVRVSPEPIPPTASGH